MNSGSKQDDGAGVDYVDACLIEALKGFVPHVMRQSGTLGLNLALARGGEVIWEEGFGYADLETKTPMTPATVTHSGSMGKLYTATAVMQLVERGAFGLHDPINRYLDSFRVINPLGEREITFYDLLTHRSGLTGNAAGSDFAPPKPLDEHLKEEYAQEMFRPYQASVVPRWSAKVGEVWQYSNFGMATLGYLVEVINPEGLGFSEYVQRHIMDPLGMTSSQYPPVQDKAHVRADIYACLSTGYAQFGPVCLPTPTIYFADYPAGTAVLTPGDHLRLLLAYMNEGTYNGHRLLQPETVRLMLTPQTDIPLAADHQMGLVWFLTQTGTGERCIRHAGAHMWGWSNEGRAYLDQDFALVVATNHWDMTHQAEGFGRQETRFISDFISTWLKREPSQTDQTPAPADVWEPAYVDREPGASGSDWAWRVSYLIGLLMAERTMGGLGIPSPFTDDMVEAMISGARVRAEAETGAPVWAPSGFRAGVRDMLSVEMTPPAIQVFLESDRAQLPFEELEVLYRDLNRAGGLLLPWYWSEVP